MSVSIHLESILIKAFGTTFCPNHKMDQPAFRFPAFLLNVRLQHALMRLACFSALALLLTLIVARGYPKSVYAVPIFTLLYHLV